MIPAEQGTEAWLAERLGHVTASRMSDVLATIKTGEAATRANYRAQLIAERLTGAIEEQYTSPAMLHGIENEPIARAAYEINTNCMVEEVGFIKHPTIAWSGASPDGLIEKDGLVEIKCPNTATHISYLMGKVVPPKYIPQMLWQLVCTQREWCDFVSFDPRLPKEYQLFIVRYRATAIKRTEAETAVKDFLQELEEAIAGLKSLRAINDIINTP